MSVPRWLLRSASPRGAIGLGVFMVLVVAACDHLIPTDASLLVFYAAPAFVVGWRTGRFPGLAVAGAAAIAWAAVRLSGGAVFDRLLVWNALQRLLIFGFVAVASELLACWSLLADTDALTGLLNRRAFLDRLAKAAARARRLPTPVAIAFLDLDRFKDVNDRFGHAAGDVVLRTVAIALESAVRAGDIVARIGGDEFAALLWRSTAPSAEQAGQRLLEEVRRALAGSEPGAGVGASVGIAIFATCPSDPRWALDRADRAMFAAKKTERRLVVQIEASSP